MCRNGVREQASHIGMSYVFEPGFVRGDDTGHVPTTEWNRFLFMSLEFVFWNLGKKLVLFMIHFDVF